MVSPTKFYHMTQVLLEMWSCDQNLVTLSFGKLSFIRIWPEKQLFLRGAIGLSSIIWVGFKNLHKCSKNVYTKSHNVFGLIPTFVEVTGEKLVGRAFFYSVLNRVKKHLNLNLNLNLMKF